MLCSHSAIQYSSHDHLAPIFMKLAEFKFIALLIACVQYCIALPASVVLIILPDRDPAITGALALGFIKPSEHVIDSSIFLTPFLIFFKLTAGIPQIARRLI